MFTELKQWEIPATELSSAKTDRLFRRGVAPFIQEYQYKNIENKLTPELINKTWQGIWGVLGDINGSNYRVPRCKFTTEKITELKNENRAVLLLPDDIYTTSGLARLINIFPLSLKWIDDQKEAQKEMGLISHRSKKGGCIDVEMRLTTPYVIAGGYNELELRREIEFDERFGQRFPTYLVASKFSQLTAGHPLDGHNTFSRITGSFYQNTSLAVGFNSDGYCEVFKCPSDKRFSNLGGRSEGVVERNKFFWQRPHGVKIS